MASSSPDDAPAEWIPATVSPSTGTAATPASVSAPASLPGMTARQRVAASQPRKGPEPPVAAPSFVIEDDKAVAPQPSPKPPEKAALEASCPGASLPSAVEHVTAAPNASASPVTATSLNPQPQRSASSQPAASPALPRVAVEPAQPIVPTVNVARVVEHLGQSEMHIGLRTTAFGSVEVHTVIRENQVGLAVGNEKGDLKSVLVAEVPALRAAFHHQDLQLESIRFLGGNAGVDMNFGSGGHADSPPSRQAFPYARESIATEDALSALPEWEVSSNSHAALNVHA